MPAHPLLLPCLTTADVLQCCGFYAYEGLFPTKKHIAMEQSVSRVTGPQQRPTQSVWAEGRRAVLTTAILVVLCVALMAVPTPTGLSHEGQRVLAVVSLAIGLWCTEALPAGVTGVVVVVALVLSGGVRSFQEALVGFAEPVVYFLIGVLTLGLAVLRSGLAERVARFFLRRCRGHSRTLYLQLLLAFPLLTFLLPSATTRTGILIHVYEQALDLSRVPRGAPLAKAIMLALNSINRLASTVLLTGGITPVVAASLIGGISWSRWLVLMSVPYGVLLTLGAGLMYLLYRQDFGAPLPAAPPSDTPPCLGWRSARPLSLWGRRYSGSRMHCTTGIRPYQPYWPGPGC
jgi:di/tricarboxylate transporter